MGATIEQLGVSVPGQIVRRHDKDADRTTISLNAAQARELYDALGPVLAFFDNGQPTLDNVYTGDLDLPNVPEIDHEKIKVTVLE
jgi:hypothetical protein